MISGSAVPHRRRWRPLGLLLAAVLGTPACGEGKGTIAAHELTLRRQVEGLRILVAEAENGTLLDFPQMLVVVDQGLIEGLLASVVPLEGDVGDGFHLRVDSARASFGDGLALVRLAGEVGLVDRPASAAVNVYGGLDVVELDPATGILRARVNLYAVDLPEGDALDGAARRTPPRAGAGRRGPRDPARPDRGAGPDRAPLRLPPLRTPRVEHPWHGRAGGAAVSSVRVFGGQMWVGVRAHVARTLRRRGTGAVVTLRLRRRHARGARHASRRSPGRRERARRSPRLVASTPR